MKNKILQSAKALSRLMQLGYLLLILLYLYLLMTPVFDWSLPAALASGEHNWLLIDVSEAQELFSSTFNIIFFSIRAIILSSLLILSLQSLIKIISSINSLSAFQMESGKHFTRVGIFMFVSFIVTILEFNYANHDLTVTFSLELQYLLLAILSWVLAEVFKEGNRLWEDNQLTI
jgi:hypothetical protein